MTLDTLRSDLRALRVDLAAARLTGVLRRWGATSAEERKYDPHAVHQPAGTRIGGRGVGGQFAPKAGGAGAALRAAAAQAGRAALADPQALADAGPAAAALAAGGVAVSRQAGLYAHHVDGQAITPILHLPGGKLETGPPPLQASASGNDQEGSVVGRFQSECEENYEEERDYCSSLAKPYGGARSSLDRKIYAICLEAAAQRRAECYQGGAFKISTPRYTLGGG